MVTHMEHGSRPGGRQKRVGTGGGNAYKRGSGTGAGPVGGGFGGGGSGRGSGTRGSSGLGVGLIGALLGFLLGKSGNSSGGSNKRGCLSRILVLILIVVGVLFVARVCSGGATEGGGTGSTLLGSLLDGATEGGTGDGSGGSLLDSLLGGSTGGSGDYDYEEDAADSVYAGLSDGYSAHAADLTVSDKARPRYTTLSGGGNDTVTLMVYLCATDLESNNGMATADLNEMLHATLNDERVNVIVETGGAKQWQNSTISSGTNQLWRVREGGLEPLEKKLGKKSMTDPATLAEFIQYCAKNYPANRYMLVLWDHGGGSLSGYGYDEYFPSDSMTLDEMDAALEEGGVQFDIIGFDACLMSTLETAVVCQRYGDYMIASEATEPGVGWYYTDWLSSLCENPSISSVALGKEIIDDFSSACKRDAASSKATLALLDLAELSGTLPADFNRFSTSITSLIDANEYASVSRARANTRDFSVSSQINQIDLIQFAENLGTSEGKALSQTLQSAIKYHRASTNVTNANGVSIFFPYTSTKGMKTALSTYEKIGLDADYGRCIQSFASVSAGGQALSTGSSMLDVLGGGSSSSLSGSLLGSLLGGSSGGADTGDLLGSILGSAASGGGTALDSLFGGTDSASATGGTLLESLLGGDSASSGSDAGDLIGSLLGSFLSERASDPEASWLDGERVMKSADYYAENLFDAECLVVSEKNGQRVLALTEDEWAQVHALAMGVFLDDGAGYIDLGLDNLVAYNDDGDLILEYDGTWLSLNGQVVPYYTVAEDYVDEAHYSFTGRVPALLNGERVNLLLSFTNELPYGTVLGAQPVYEALDTSAKGTRPIRAGDKLDFLCDYYAYDGTFEDSYFLGEQMTATGEWTIENLPVATGALSCLMTYRVTDLYGNAYWTPIVKD